MSRTRPGSALARIDPPHAPPAPAAAGRPDLGAAILASLATRTAAAYRKDYAAFATFVGADSGDAALEAFVALEPGRANACALAWRAAMQEAGLAPATVARRLSALKTAVRFARLTGRVAWTLDVPRPRVETLKDVRGPGLMGVVKMLAVLDGRAGPKAVRDRAILRLLWGLALRRGELVRLDLEDLDLDGNRVAVLGKGKTAKTWLTLPEGARVALAAWLEVRGLEPGPLFLGFGPGRSGGRLTDSAVYRLVRDLGREAGLARPVRPHAIRHAAITECSARSNGNAPATKRFGRHASTATTDRYIDEFEDVFGQMAAIVDRAVEG